MPKNSRSQTFVADHDSRHSRRPVNCGLFVCFAIDILTYFAGTQLGWARGKLPPTAFFTRQFYLTSFATNVYPECHKWGIYKQKISMLAPLVPLFYTPIRKKIVTIAPIKFRQPPVDEHSLAALMAKTREQGARGRCQA